MIVTRQMMIGGDETKSIDDIPLSPDKAAASRDALAKTLYEKLFDWLVGRVNEALRGDGTALVEGSGASRGRSLAILDIFGFEIFVHNSFEQLLINYTNEWLQSHFNLHVFLNEEALYQSEGIDMPTVGFIDNTPTLEVLDGKPTDGRGAPMGILTALDEQVPRLPPRIGRLPHSRAPVGAGDVQSSLPLLPTFSSPLPLPPSPSCGQRQTARTQLRPQPRPAGEAWLGWHR